MHAMGSKSLQIGGFGACGRGIPAAILPAGDVRLAPGVVASPMSDDRTTLILPVENQVRELDAKLLLACVAAERGFPVVMGSRALVHHRVSSIPRGVYLAKSLRRLSDKMFGILDKLGHDIVAWDEEALVRLRDANFYYGRRLSPKTLRLTSALFAWGPENEALFRGYPGYDGTPIYVTGNPRTDMMRPELRGYYAEEIEQIHKRYDRFVLVNTNFGWNNHFLRAFRVDQPAGRPKNAFEAGLAAHRTAQFESFQQMLPALARSLPDYTILIRPHPTEDHELWREIAKDLPNARVANDGNVVPWLMACETLIHVGCTTAVEAAVIGRPAIAYQSRSPKSSTLRCRTSSATTRSAWTSCWRRPGRRSRESWASRAAKTDAC